jgi:hypothetical protein
VSNEVRTETQDEPTTVIFRYTGQASLMGLVLCVAILLSWQAFKPPKAVTSHGIHLNLVTRGPDPQPYATDGDGLYTLVIQSNKIARIRHEEIPLANLGSRLRTVFSTRSERLLMIAVEGQVTFGEVLSFLDAARSVENMDFVLLTPNSVPVRQEPSLFMKGEAIYTQYSFPFVSSPIAIKRAR